MKELEGGDKVRVLLAQALFGNPDVLLLDEPTNHLDHKSIAWLEDFLARFQNTVIVVSHDRHFLNQVCTHIADIDYGKIQVFVGNYDFWCQASRLIQKQKQNENKKATEKANELTAFIQRFSSNASKAKQATSRKKLLEKITLDEMPVSSRKYPWIVFKPERACGTVILEIENLTKTIDGEKVLNNFSMVVNSRGQDRLCRRQQPGQNRPVPDPGRGAGAGLRQLPMGPDRHHRLLLQGEQPLLRDRYTLVQWLLQYAPDEGINFARSFLGRMLFSGEEAMKKTGVLSGGEKVRCMLARMMLTGANVLLLDEPTNHLDLEAITSLNDGLMAFPEVILFASNDHQFVSTVANRIVELTPKGAIDRAMGFDDYLASARVAQERQAHYCRERALAF